LASKKGKNVESFGQYGKQNDVFINSSRQDESFSCGLKI